MLFKINARVKMAQILPFLVSVLVTIRIIYLHIPISLPLYYGTLFVVLIICLPGRGFRFNLYLLLFVCASLLSILLNNIPLVFNSNYRLLSFLIIAGLVSPLILNEKLRAFRLKIITYLNRAILLIVSLSFLAHFSGIYSGQGGSGFQGLTNHSMTMGSVAALSMLISLGQSYTVDISRNEKIFYILVALMSFTMMLLAGSRAAVLGVLSAFVAYFFKMYQLRLGKFFQAIFIALFILVASAGVWSDFTDTLNFKTSASIESTGGVTSSRDDYWGYRVKEFKESPLYGVGFSVIRYGVVSESGGVEPGSSWLALFSMTGVLGGILFVLLIISLLKKLFFYQSTKTTVPFLFAMLIFFMVHWLFEGYMLASGTFESFYAWLILGVISLYNKSEQIEIV